MGRSSRTSIGVVALVAIGLVAVLAAPGGAVVPPPPAEVRLTSSSVRQGSTVIVRTSNSRCGVAVSRPGVDTASFVGQISLVNPRNGAVIIERRVRSSESVRGVLNAGLRIPSVLATGRYLVYAACFNSSFELATYFSPAPLTVVGILAARPVGPPTVTPSTVAARTDTTVTVRLPAACDTPGRRIHLDMTLGRFDADGSRLVSAAEPTVAPAGVATLATLAIPRTMDEGRYLLNVNCRSLSFDRFSTFDPAVVVIGSPAPASPGRLTVSPTSVTAGGTVRITGACPVGETVTVFHRQTGESLGLVATGTTSARTISLPVTMGAGVYLVRASCTLRDFLPVIVTVAQAPLVSPSRPATTASPNVVNRGTPFFVRVDRRVCRPAASSVSFPVNAQRAVLVQRSTGVKVAERSWNFVNTGFSFSTSARAAGTYLLFVSCREVGVGDSYFEPLVVVIR